MIKPKINIKVLRAFRRPGETNPKTLQLVQISSIPPCKYMTIIPTRQKHSTDGIKVQRKGMCSC